MSKIGFALAPIRHVFRIFSQEDEYFLTWDSAFIYTVSSLAEIYWVVAPQ